MAGLLSTGGALLYAGVIVLLVAAALAIGEALNHPWLGALIVGGGLLLAAAVAAAIGWAERVREPLPHTSREAKKEIAWARRQVTT